MSWKFWQREPRPSDGSVQLPTTATTNQFIENAAEKAAETVVGKYWWGVVELNKQLQQRIKELEAEVERLTELYQEDTVTTWDQKQEVERLRKAIGEAGRELCPMGIAIPGAGKAADILQAALSPSPAAENKSNGSQGTHKPATRPQANEAEPAAATEAIVSAPATESEPTASSDRGVHAQELPPEEDIIHWNTDWRTAVPGGGNSGVIQQQPELADLRLRLETCEERLGHTESERDAAIAKCNAADEKIAAWRRLIHEQRARIVALEKEKGFPSRFGDEPMFDVNHVENRVVPPEFLLSKVAKDWVVDPALHPAGPGKNRATRVRGRAGFLKLGVRARKTLLRLNINTVGQLMQHTSQEILAILGTGCSTLREIQEALAECDLYLLDDPRRK